MSSGSKGWVKLHRSSFEWRHSPLVVGRPFTRFEAFLYLFTMASHKDHTVGEVCVHRGQLLTSIEGLAEKWRRDRKTVRRWLKDFEKHGEIRIETRTTHSLVTICNYSKYQGDGTSKGTSDGTSNGTQSRMDKNEKEPTGLTSDRRKVGHEW